MAIEFTEGQFFFGIDLEGEYYLIPESMRSDWDRLNKPYQTWQLEQRVEFTKLFYALRIADPSNYTVTDPQYRKEAA